MYVDIALASVVSKSESDLLCFFRSYASLNFLTQNWKVKNELLCFCLSTNLLFLFVCSGLRPENDKERERFKFKRDDLR